MKGIKDLKRLKNNKFSQITKSLGFLLMGAISFTFIGTIIKDDIKSLASNYNKDEMPSSTIIEYETVYLYNDKLPSDVVKVINDGVDGFVYVNEDYEAIAVPMEPEIVEKGTGPTSTYYGNITGYGPDCYRCTGILNCPTNKGEWINLFDNGPIYVDEEFGEVRILAAALDQFPCGTIIEVTDNRNDSFLGIVLDTGSAMVNAYNRGKVHIDVAFSSETDKEVLKMTDFSGTVLYKVQRWGF